MELSSPPCCVGAWLPQPNAANFWDEPRLRRHRQLLAVSPVLVPRAQWGRGGGHRGHVAGQGRWAQGLAPPDPLGSVSSCTLALSLRDGALMFMPEGAVAFKNTKMSSRLSGQ